MVPNEKYILFFKKRKEQGQKPVEIALHVKSLHNIIDVVITLAIKWFWSLTNNYSKSEQVKSDLTRL